MQSVPTRAASRTRLEQSLTAVLEISQVINLSLGLRPMLQLLAEKVHSLMSYDCAVILLEPGSLLLTWAGYYGISDDYVRAMNAQGNNLATPEMAEGATGRAFRSREPVQITDFGDRSVRLWREMAEREGFVSFIATPMVFHERVVGFINCYTRQRHVFSPPEVELLRIIGNQAAIAVEAARSFGEEQQRARELNDANRALGEQRQLLQSQYEQIRQGEQIHQQLTEVILEDLGLEAVVQRIADLTARPVHLYDRNLKHLAAARADPPVDAFHAACLSTGEFAPSAWRLQTAAQASRVDCSPDRGRYSRFVVPVTTGSTVLGYVVVVEAPEPLEGLALRAVEHGATVLALELLKQRAIGQVEQQLRGSLLDDLIGGDYESDEAVARRARHLGFDLRRAYRVLVVAFDPLPESVGEAVRPSEEMQRQLLDLGLLMCQAYWTGGLVTRRNDVLAIVRPEERAAATPAVGADILRAEAKRSLGDHTISVGIGSACHRIEDFSRSFAEARYCLELVHRFGNVDRSLSVDELGLHRLLIGSQSKAQLSQFAHERLDRLISYDRRRGGELLETLTAYLTTECSLLRTSESLVLHVNTVQYRLRRIEELTGARLRGPHGLMEIHLALLIAFLNPREFPEVASYTARLAAAAP